MTKSFFTSLILLLVINCTSLSQEYFRIRADFTVKISNSDGTKSLTRGTLYYDKNIKDLIYDMTFPRVEKWISRDTSLYKFRNDSLIQRTTIPSINEFTVFHLALNAGLNDFGLKNSVYAIQKVEKKGDLVLSYWQIPKQASVLIDHVVIAKKSNRLESVIMVDNTQRILSRQFFRNYIRIGAFEFPQQIVQILDNRITGREDYQETEFRNITVNDLSDNKMYQAKHLKYD
ncbi:MAG: hypothetical protein K0B05_03910 [Bacteroidales bacterium]|nr:hypothetical protein [Bacteroidales bacterium]